MTSAVPCAGCGEPIPYDGPDMHREWLRTPLGITVAKTHRDRACVQASRARVEGRPFVPGPTREQRLRERLG